MSNNDLITLVTYSTNNNNPAYHNWVYAAKRLGYKYETLGLGEKWTDWPQRTKAYAEFLKTKPDDDIIVLVDAYDLYVVQPPAVLYKLYKKHYKDAIVFGAEKLCCTANMNTNKLVGDVYRIFCKQMALFKHIPKENDYVYLNAGFVIGPAAALAQLYTDILNCEYDTDDQSALGYLWMEDPFRFVLDYDSILVGNIVTEDDDDITNKNMKDWDIDSHDFLLTRKFSNAKPCVLHFPGIEYEKIYELLGVKAFDTKFNIPKVVVSMTTTPKRIEKLEKTVMSILNQTVRVNLIYLNIPYKSKRFGTEYKIPESIQKLPVIINRCDDYGPLTKLLPTLEKENNPTTLIITVDDDYTYSPNMIEDLILSMEMYDNHAFSYSGLKANKKKNKFEHTTMFTRTCSLPVDVLQGYAGAIYKRDFFQNLNLLKSSTFQNDELVFLNDDILISCYLKSVDVKLVALPYQEWITTENDEETPLRNLNNPGAISNEYKCYIKLTEFFNLGLDDKSQEIFPTKFLNIKTQPQQSIDQIKTKIQNSRHIFGIILVIVIALLILFFRNK